MSSTDPVRRRRPVAETRELILRAGHRLLAERGFRDQVDIRLADAVKAAGYTTGAAYQIWKSQAEFQRELALHIVGETGDWAGVETIGDDLEAVLLSEPSFEEMVRAAGGLYMRSFLGREEFYTMLPFFASRERHPDVTEAMRRGYDGVHEDFRLLFAALLELYGRTFREPFELDDLCVSATALAEGLALRHRVDPDRIRDEIGDPEAPWHIYSAALVAFAHHYTEEG